MPWKLSRSVALVLSAENCPVPVTLTLTAPIKNNCKWGKMWSCIFLFSEFFKTGRLYYRDGKWFNPKLKWKPLFIHGSLMVKYFIASQKRGDLPFSWTVACLGRRHLNSVVHLGSSAEILSLCALRIQRIIGRAFQTFFHTDWQLDNGFFNRPSVARTQLLVHRWAIRTSISALFCRQT